jgi:hypothetical protein
MAWGKLPSEQRAAAEAAEAAVVRASERTRMTPFERQLLAVLADIRDALQTTVDDTQSRTDTGEYSNNP